MSDLTINEQYESGKMVLVQAIFDVDFKDSFILEDKLGKIASSLEQKYVDFDFSFINDKPKNANAIQAANGYKIFTCSRKNFRINRFMSNVARIVEPLEFDKDIKNITHTYCRSLTEAKNAEFEKSVIVKRVGVRLIFATNLNQDHIQDPQIKSKLLTDVLLEGISKDSDKLHALKIHIGDENIEKARNAKERVLTVLTAPVEVDDEKNHSKIEFPPSVIIDYTEHTHNPNKVDVSLYTDAVKTLFDSKFITVFNKERQ